MPSRRAVPHARPLFMHAYPGMHPAVRILGVILYIACVAQGGWPVLMAGGALVAAALARLGPPGLRRFAAMAARLKWFFLSIVLVFGWFTPGLPLAPGLGPLSPSVTGVLQGLERTLVLLLAVGAVVWLLQGTSRERLVQGLLWLTRPLARLAFPRERFAVRLVLTLEALPQVRLLAAEAATSGAQAGGPRQRLRRLGDRAADLFHRVLQAAEEAPLDPIRLPSEAPPAPRHWLALALVILPLALLALAG
ncbi:energy-coupling factor transport system permease protein [Ectothiorhodospira mobilis]|uniref:Energy-coupling factor transport system permease protein n=2 Tax=Ectothiorhodospira mobilis TaxID=195064 RepID=A0A1I4SQH4_ECTMO|nr:energy-coupling factor transport system permease protein [Ectothiorhodospira mobilis]